MIKQWFFFYFNHFSLIIFYHSVCLGFELFRLRVQVWSQLVQFTLTCKGYDNHHCHNKPQTENEAGVWMTSCPKEIGREFENRPWCWEVKIRPCSWRLTLDHAGRQLSFYHWGIENWVLCHWVDFSTVAAAFKFFGSRPAKMNWEQTPQDVPNVGGDVSIVWLRKTFKNCVSLHVSKNKT